MTSDLRAQGVRRGGVRTTQGRSLPPLRPRLQSCSSNFLDPSEPSLPPSSELADSGTMTASPEASASESQ